MPRGDTALIDSSRLRTDLARAAPTVWRELADLAEQYTAPAFERIRTQKHAGYPKTFNDPIWGVVELLPWETLILDSPLLQRLRGVRQLGMAHLVYPGAGHDRLEHTRGVVEAAERMIRALERNADHRRRFGRNQDKEVPAVSDEDRYATRLAALLHDIGHGPFSHATEQLIWERQSAEFRAAAEVLRENFEGVTTIACGEIIAVLIVLSGAMDRILKHERMVASTRSSRLPEAIAARILGSRSCLQATYLSGVISGPVDADKLDYVARDCHHSGLPLGIDLTRLISKLEVVVVTPDTAPNDTLQQRAKDSCGGRFYDMGISQSGLGSYEQLVIARVLLHDRLYYHHKVRAAEAMLQRLVRLAEEENRARYSLDNFLTDVSDDIFAGAIGGEISSRDLPSGGPRSLSLAEAIRERRVYYRAHAFGARFIAGLEGLSGKEQRSTRALMWRRVLRDLSNERKRRIAEQAIYDKARQLAEVIPELKERADGLMPEEILVDLPLNKVVVRGGDILTRTDSGHVGTPNLFFDPERWSRAYEHQKQCGFVFTPRQRVPVVAMASRIVFFDTYDLVMDEQAALAAKVTNIMRDEWVEIARECGLCTPECAETLLTKRSRLVSFRAGDIDLPGKWESEDHEARSRISDDLNRLLPSGLPASFHEAVVSTVRELALFIDLMETGGPWASADDLPEKELQTKLRDHLRSREIEVAEGSEVGGGENDLILCSKVVVENKVRKERTADPFEAVADAPWQARRYSIPLCSRVVFVVVAYRPTDEAALLPLPHRIQVRSMDQSSEQRCEVRVVVPWGTGVPSSAKRPKAV